MAVSKRLRYEILRRDNHACRYCGATAPEAKLTVDHVVPVALGGNDEPSNLVTACAPCNSGKTSSSPDAPIVDDVAAKALQWAAAMRAAADEDHARRDAREDVLNAVAAVWPSYRHIPAGWESSVGAILDAGLPPEVVVEMARVATSAPGVGNRFSYFCGCCWKRVRQLQDRALQIVSEVPNAS